VGKNNKMKSIVQIFKKSVSALVDIISKSKKEYHESICNSLNTNLAGSKDYWEVVGQLLDKKFSQGLPTLE
jgi:hypothetical protein